MTCTVSWLCLCFKTGRVLVIAALLLLVAPNLAMILVLERDGSLGEWHGKKEVGEFEYWLEPKRGRSCGQIRQEQWELFVEGATQCLA